ncbi:MFS transporter [Belnapia moabensis]|uniref:MFS transporter n=1 Tax=Belnapia moabensis TaxID=365533 RepID=UPI0005BE3AFA|nr:MFS transporter [Belnapia moabensis]
METLQSRRGPLTLLAVLTFARVAYGVQFQSVGAVGPAMIADLGLDHALLGTLVGAYSVLGLALSLLAGWLIAQLGHRRIVLAGLSLLVLGGFLLGAAPGFAVALAGRLISGAGAVLLLVALPAIVAGLFTGPTLPAAMGTLLAGYPLGIGMGFVALPLFGSWRGAMAVTAVLALISLAAAATTLTGTSGGGGMRRSVRLNAREIGAVTAAALVWGLPNAGFAVLLGFAPVFFVGRGMSAEAAAALVSLVAFATVPVGPLGGWLLGRLPRPLLGIAGGIALAAAATLALTLDVAPAALLVVVGVALGSTAGPIVALPAAVLAPEHRALGMGLFWTIFFLPMTFLPPLAGLAHDLTGDAAAPLGAAAAFAATALLALVAYAKLRQPIVVAASAG